MEETKPWVGSGGPSEPRVRRSVVSWVKRWLRGLSASRSLEEGGEGPPADGQKKEVCRCRRHHIPLAVVIVVALVVMALLLLLNYKCYMVWRLCEDNQVSSSYMSLEEP